MSKPLPIIISVPHAGQKTPDIVKELTSLSEEQIRVDGDEGASEIYNFKDRVHSFFQTDIARAFIDLNRKPMDFSRDGVVKTHTCQMDEVYDSPLSRKTIGKMLEQHYHPWHEKLAKASLSNEILFGVDCHTMAATAPGISSDFGKKRPFVCLSNADGSCPNSWLDILAQEFKNYFGVNSVEINDPFKGGYIIRKHSLNLNWIQIELSRAPFADNKEKKEVVFEVLSRFTETLF